PIRADPIRQFKMDDDSSFDTLLARATNPLSRDLDVAAVQQLCDRILVERDGTNHALRFLAHKIQSPQEREAIQALLVLEECATRCGAKFQDEVFKFRFLNELIKVVSPKADRRMELLARRTVEIETVHNNAKVLKDMLNNYRPGDTSAEEKELMKELFESCERLRPKLFRLAGEMEEKDEGLNEILTANDELTNVINIYKRAMGLEVTVNGARASMAQGASLLDLGSPQMAESGGRRQSQSDMCLLDDQLLALGINDPAPAPPSATTTSTGVNATNVGTTMAELGTIFGAAPSPGNIGGSPGNFMSFVGSGPSAALAGLGVRMGPGGYSPAHQAGPPQMLTPSTASVAGMSPLKPSLVAIGQTVAAGSGEGSGYHSVIGGFTRLGVMSSTPQKIPLNQIQKSQPPSASAIGGAGVTGASNGVPSSGMGMLTSASANLGAAPPSLLDLSPADRIGSPGKSPSSDPLSLSDVFVPLELVQPGSQLPLTLHDLNGVKVIVHFAKNQPQPHVSVMVVSTMSTNTSSVKKVLFQAAVPKTMRIKLQPPSATELPPHNPILPPAAITQVMLLANPSKDKVRMKYKVSYAIGDETHTDVGE
ncbi:golgi associated, gamma adaptin ear containing, arf binding protein, putative, partial [Ixodes scapularis]